MKKLQVWLPLLIALVLTAGMMAGFKLRENIPYSQAFFQTSRRSSLQEVMDLVREKYVDPFNTDSLSQDAIQAMLQHLDPHSVYIPASNLQSVNEDLQGNFQGIGVEFNIINDTVNVINVLKQGPSNKAGLQLGDKFIQVNDSLVAGNHISSEKIRKLLRGPAGSQVRVKLLRDRQVMPAVITRGTIPLYSLDAAYMIDSTTGFIHLNKFAGTTYEEFMQAMEKLQQQGMKSLVLDLRGNGGGILGEAVDIADEFLDDEKLIVYTQGHSQPKTEYHAKRPGLFEKGRLTLLVDETSASASEVLAGALQDWDRATIIGRRTFGKGLVQEQYDLSDGAALRLTVARYYTPVGRSIQKPYDKGHDAYNEELTERFQNGEVLVGDTARHSGIPYKTPHGRIVYGGGGITPDIFVPFDTASISNSTVARLFSESFGNFIYNYYVQHKSTLNQYKDPIDFARHFRVTDTVWNELVKYTARDSVDMKNIASRDKEEIQRRVVTWMARQIWRMEGYYEANNLDDRAVQKALEELKKK